MRRLQRLILRENSLSGSVPLGHYKLSIMELLYRLHGSAPSSLASTLPKLNFPRSGLQPFHRRASTFALEFLPDSTRTAIKQQFHWRFNNRVFINQLVWGLKKRIRKGVVGPNISSSPTNNRPINGCQTNRIYVYRFVFVSIRGIVMEIRGGDFYFSAKFPQVNEVMLTAC